MDKELLEAFSALLDAKLKPIEGRLDKMQADLDVLKEDAETLKEDSTITRTAVNTLLEWAEEAQIEVKIPLYKKAQ